MLTSESVLTSYRISTCLYKSMFILNVIYVMNVLYQLFSQCSCNSQSICILIVILWISHNQLNVFEYYMKYTVSSIAVHSPTCNSSKINYNSIFNCTLAKSTLVYQYQIRQISLTEKREYKYLLNWVFWWCVVCPSCSHRDREHEW